MYLDLDNGIDKVTGKMEAISLSLPVTVRKARSKLIVDSNMLDQALTLAG